MSSIRDTSLLAWQELEPVLGLRQQTVYVMLKVLGSASNMELSKALGWSVNRVTPRVLELRRAGLVFYERHRVCTVTGRIVYAWRVR